MTVFRARPFATALFAYLAGMLLLVLTEEHTRILLLVFPGISALLAATAILLRKKKTAGRSFALLSLAFLFLFCRGVLWDIGSVQPALSLRGTQTTLFASVTEMNSAGNGILRLENGVMVYVRDLKEPYPKEKDRVEIRLCFDEDPVIPASYGFDTKRYFHANSILVTAQAGDFRTVGREASGWSESAGDSLRALLSDLKYAHLADAVVLGNTDSIDPALSQALSQTQTRHLLAVSGLHISLLLFSLAFLLEKLRLPLKLRVILTVAVLLFYMALLDFAPAVTRAGIMSMTFFGAKALRRGYDPFTSLLLAAAILCTADPGVLFDNSFLLSALSTLGIIRAALPLMEELNRCDFFSSPRLIPAFFKEALRFVAQNFILTLSALIFSLPVLTRFAPLLNPMSLAANLMLIILFTPALISVLIYLPLKLIALVFRWDFLAIFAAGICDGFFSLFEQMAILLANVFPSLQFPAGAAASLVLILLLTLVALLRFRPRTAAMLTVLAVFLSFGADYIENRLTDARITVIRNRFEPIVLVEAQGRTLLYLPEGCGETTPYLAELLKNRRLDEVILPSKRLSASLIQLSRHCEIDAVRLDSQPDERGELLCRQKGIQILAASFAEVYSLGDSLRFRCADLGTAHALDLEIGDAYFSYRVGFDGNLQVYSNGFGALPDCVVFVNSPRLIPTENLEAVSLYVSDRPSPFGTDGFVRIDDLETVTLILAFGRFRAEA